MTRSSKKGKSITAFARVRTRPPRPDEPRPITAPLNRAALTPPPTRAGDTLVPSAQGDYTAYYDGFAAAVGDGGRGPVPAEEGIAVLAVLDAARESAARGAVVDIS